MEPVNEPDDSDDETGSGSPSRKKRGSQNSESVPERTSAEAAFLLELHYPSVGNLFRANTSPPADKSDAIVAFDTNVLLFPYNISPDNLSALSDVYRKLARDQRAFLPARAVREFIVHRDRKIADMLKALNDMKSKMTIPQGRISPLFEGIAGHEKLSEKVEAFKKARDEVTGSIDEIAEQIRNWQWDDPVTKLYGDVFTNDRIVELDEPKEELLKEWEDRLNQRRPPGLKDVGKIDGGIGDFLIWKSLLKIGKARQKDLILVTREEKSDWFIKSDKSTLYPRPELIAEYREYSGGKSLRLISLHQLLREMKVSGEVADEVQSAELKEDTPLSGAQEDFGNFGSLWANSSLLSKAAGRGGLGGLGGVEGSGVPLAPEWKFTSFLLEDEAVVLLIYPKNFNPRRIREYIRSIEDKYLGVKVTTLPTSDVTSALHYGLQGPRVFLDRVISEMKEKGWDISYRFFSQSGSVLAEK